MGIGNTTPATVLIATLTSTEPVAAVGRGTGVDDAGWMRKVTAIRDAMRRARPHTRDPDRPAAHSGRCRFRRHGGISCRRLRYAARP